jgi:hypothetical protein
MNARSRLVRAFEAMLSLVVLVLLVLLADARDANAHEARPAYLALTETAPGLFDVVWRTPVASGMRLPVVLQLPDGAPTSPNRAFTAVRFGRRTQVDRRAWRPARQAHGFVGLQGAIIDARAVETRWRIPPRSSIRRSRGSRFQPHGEPSPWRVRISCTAWSISCSDMTICCSWSRSC